MTTAEQVAQATVTPKPKLRTTPSREPGTRGQWWRFAAMVVISVIVLVPVFATVLLAIRPSTTSTSTNLLTLENFSYVFANSGVLLWLSNSLGVTLATVIVSVVVAAPAGYVLSRGRSKAVSGYSLLLFVIQSLPVITAVIPLFVLFARIGLADNLLGLVIVYVGSTMSVATWMMAAYFDSIPHALEEAAWVDGCSVFGSFSKIVLRNSLPGILSTAIFAFLVAWNDYLVVLVFIKSSNIFTLPLGLQTFFQQNLTDWGAVMAVSVVMLLPPAIIFAVLNKYFSVGGIGGSLAGRLPRLLIKNDNPNSAKHQDRAQPAALGADASRLRPLGTGTPDRLWRDRYDTLPRNSGGSTSWPERCGIQPAACRIRSRAGAWLLLRQLSHRDSRRHRGGRETTRRAASRSRQH